MIEIGTHPNQPGKLVWRDKETGRAGVLWEDTPDDIRRDAVERGLLPYSTSR
jgi:hypothetical protein